MINDVTEKTKSSCPITAIFLPNKYLCAYIVSQSEIQETALRDYLLKELPDYMIPSYFIQLNKIPLTANGKIDRKALPQVTEIASTGYAAPVDELEEMHAYND